MALELANLAIKSPKSDDVWEQLLSTYTLHCLQGRSIFEAYRLYLAKQDTAKSEEYYQKLIEAYERELSLPLKDMEETYIELKVTARHFYRLLTNQISIFVIFPAAVWKAPKRWTRKLVTHRFSLQQSEGTIAKDLTVRKEAGRFGCEKPSKQSGRLFRIHWVWSTVFERSNCSGVVRAHDNRLLFEWFVQFWIFNPSLILGVWAAPENCILSSFYADAEPKSS